MLLEDYMKQPLIWISKDDRMVCRILTAEEPVLRLIVKLTALKKQRFPLLINPLGIILTGSFGREFTKLKMTHKNLLLIRFKASGLSIMFSSASGIAIFTAATPLIIFV
jgi:hypothetical protein